jgi:hypothetical protein
LARSAREVTKTHRVAIGAGGLVFIAFGLPILYFMFLGPFVGYVRSLSWPETPCTILESGVYSTGTSPGSSGRRGQPTHRPQFTYSYVVDGREYRSDRYTFFLLTIDGYDKAAREAALHPVGSRATCYVDPADPREAVFSREFRVIQLVGLVFPGIFMAMGLFAIGFAIRGERRRDAYEQAGLPPLPEPDRDAVTTLGTGAVTLKPQQTAFGAFVGAVVGSVVWNGILALFAYLPLKDTIDAHDGSILRTIREVGPQVLGSPETWVGLLCGSPFVLIGLMLIVSIPYQALALFNPRPRVTLSAPSIPAGGTARLHWRLSSGGAGIKRLTIVLEARQPLAGLKPTVSLRLVDLTPPQTIEEGTVTIAIPADAPVSSIESRDPSRFAMWTIRLTGTITIWPDVDVIYPVVITPARG